MEAVPATGRLLLSGSVVGRRLRHSRVAITRSAGGLTKAMFFIFRYLCCTRMVCPRMVEPGPGASMQALRCRNGRARQGDGFGREAVLLCAADGHGVCARRRFMIYDLRFTIYDPWLGSGGQIINRKSEGWNSHGHEGIDYGRGGVHRLASGGAAARTMAPRSSILDNLSTGRLENIETLPVAIRGCSSSRATSGTRPWCNCWRRGATSSSTWRRRSACN